VRNGPQFEAMMREKQRSNPEFSFLVGGEHAAYYNWAVFAMVNGWSQEQADGQVKAYQQARNQAAVGTPASRGIVGFTAQEQTEFDDFVNTMTRSKESIRTGKEWILSHCHCADAITGRLRDAVKSSPDFDRRLNVVYLVSDVLFNCVKRAGAEKDNMSNALARDLVFILRDAFQGATTTDQEKVSKVVDLWSERQILDQGFVKTLKDGMASPIAPPEPMRPTPQAPQMPAAMVPPNMGYPGAPPMNFSPGAPQMMMGMPGAPMMPMPQMTPPPKPDGIPVDKLPMGLLIQQIDSRSKPYTPLDPTRLPSSIPPTHPPSSELLDNLKRFYEAGEDSRDRRRERSRSSDRRRERDRSPRGGSGRRDEFAPPRM